MRISRFIITLLICSAINVYGTEITDNTVTKIQIDGIQIIDKETVIS